MSNERTDGNKAYGNYYCYGRKDPFCGLNKNLFSGSYSYDSSSQKFVQRGKDIVSTNPSCDLAYATRYPGRLIDCGDYGGEWLYFNKYSSNIWNNPSWNILSGSEKTVKSLFDPCPPGWRLPNGNIWSDITKGKFTWYNDSQKGLIYNICGAYYPPCGGRGYMGRDSETYGLTSACRAGTNDVFLCNNGSIGSAGYGLGTQRNYAIPVRCIQE